MTVSLLFYGCDTRKSIGAPNSSASNCKNAANVKSKYSQLLRWDVPQQRTDGTLLNKIAGYRIYFGTVSGIYAGCIDIQNVENIKDKQGVIPALSCKDIVTKVTGMSSKKRCDYSVPLQNEGNHYFTMTAYDENGNESDFSNEVSKLVSIVASIQTTSRP